MLVKQKQAQSPLPPSGAQLEQLLAIIRPKRAMRPRVEKPWIRTRNQCAPRGLVFPQGDTTSPRSEEDRRTQMGTLQAQLPKRGFQRTGIVGFRSFSRTLHADKLESFWRTIVVPFFAVVCFVAFVVDGVSCSCAEQPPTMAE